MANINDVWDDINARGYNGNPALYSHDFANPATLGRTTGVVKTLDTIDQKWANVKTAKRAPDYYFDYYYTSQDVKVTVDGTEDDPEFGELPIVAIGFNVEQQKRPVFGFWSNTYDAVMRGNRIVQGQLVLATRSTNYMRRLLEKAATSRVTRSRTYDYPRPPTDDAKNVEEFWGRTLDPALTDAGRHIFSVHPPFSLVITYGLQNLSIDTLMQASDKVGDLYDQYRTQHPMSLDVNERLIEGDTQGFSRIVIDECELTSVQYSHNATDSQVAIETYTFFARDIVWPVVHGSNSG